MMNGDFDQELDDAAELATARSNITENKMSRSNSKLDNQSIEHNRQSLISSATGFFNIDSVLREMDSALIPTPPMTARRSNTPHLFTCDDEYRSSQAGGGFFAQNKFYCALKRDMKEAYDVEITITKSKDDSHLENSIYIVHFQSENAENIHMAQKALRSLFNSTKIKIIDDKSEFWTQEQDCVRIVQAYADQNERLHISCEYSTIGLFISYFDENISTVLPHLCTTDVILGRILKEKFRSVDINLPVSSDLTTKNISFFAQDILKLEAEFRHHPILIKLEQRYIRLFGILDLINEIEQQIENIKTKYASNMVQLNLEPFQIKYLLDIHSHELQEIEKRFMDAKIIEYLSNGEFIAPSYVQNTIKKQIIELAALCPPIHFIIEEEAFRPIAHKECSNLIDIGRQYKCHIDIEEHTVDHVCEIPRATVKDHVSNKLTAAAIDIKQGDLAEQNVDLVVVCSTSFYLCQNLINKAGHSVKQEYDAITNDSPSEPFETNAGDLKCRKLLFLPWKIDKASNRSFTQSIRNFVRTAVQYAVKGHHTSIAFPSIGCGKLNVGKNIIANEMLIEAQKQLLMANVLLQIIFVILPKQNDVFEAFKEKLDCLQKGNIEMKDAQVSYRLSTLLLIIISSNEQKQRECLEALNNYVQKSIAVSELLQQTALKKWSQPALNKFYRLCRHHQVVIDINLQIGYLKLYGSKEAVRDAENAFLNEQIFQSEQARLAAIARDIIWAYEIEKNKWEKYPPEVNALIEDQYSSKISSFKYVNDKSEECTIDFQTMTEKCLNRVQERSIIRQGDFAFPNNWQVQSTNVDQFPLPILSDEFKQIHNLFNTKMASKYSEIVRIDRIQNIPWFMQYNSYRNFSSKKHTEKKLFHGCPQQTVPLIVNSFFNRSFAGINGVVYGQGAYFSSDASYSHSYATKNATNDERCMFVADVLIGDTIQGNSKMKTPPAGYDSTTDGNHIFVTYRDDQAYASYLIVYK
ncbi:hypothetical protein I4U23_006458 [Adineta vaga]|nr:hypothetical protein I4U23_006458 [Adineta vaga]